MAGKKYRAALQKVDRNKRYSVDEAAKLITEMRISSKWDETVDVAVRLGVDPKHADQMVRGAVVLPHGSGKSKRVLVIANPDKAKEALAAGADFAGGEEYTNKIKDENWFEFDAIVATPDMMGTVGKIGRVLGPRGLMPNPKVGTVTMDIAKAVGELKAGRVEFRVEKTGIVHAPIAKASFSADKIAGNLAAMLETLMKLKPSTAKGNYMRSVVVSTTHGPGIKIETAGIGASNV